MNNIFKGLIAGYGASKLGGGCIGTIIVFVIIWIALGSCQPNCLEKNDEETIMQFLLIIV